MSQKIGDNRIQVTLTDEEFEQVQRIAKRHKLKYAQVVRNMMLLGLDVYDDLDVVGVVGLLEIYEKGKKWLNRVKESRQLRLI